MFKHLLQAGLLSAMFAVGSTASANVLNTAEALWKFDAAASGAVSTGQITDSLNGHHASSVTNADLMNWTSTPATGPGGAPAVGPDARGLEFNPVVQTAGEPDDVRNTGFVVNNFAITGSATLITRFRWDGYVSDDSNAKMTWIYNNGLGGLDVGWMFGIRGSDNKLTIHQNTHSYDSELTLETGVWYDAAVVLHNNADENLDSITFYLIKEGGSLQIASRLNKVAGQAHNTTRVGSESLGSGNFNERKAFDGVMDYLAVWDQDLGSEQVRSVLIPEPAAFSAGLAVMGMLALRRRGR